MTFWSPALLRCWASVEFHTVWLLANPNIFFYRRLNILPLLLQLKLPHGAMK
ncbi:MAG: hypothetical protein N6V49_00815 [Serratia symbiotica]|nr:hypothetical protein [Serratia symbiotica]